MGVLDRLRNWGGKAAVPNPNQPSIAGLNLATVTRVEDRVNEWRDVAGYSVLSEFVKGLALDLAMFNAKCLASVPMRLYMPEGAARRKRLECKRAGRSQTKRLRTASAVGAKAAMRAEQAGEVVEVLDHPVLDLIRRPSPATTAMSWDLLRWVNKQMYGDAVMLKIRGNERPIAAIPHLRPQWLRVQPDKEVGIAGYYYGRDKQDSQNYDIEDVYVFPWADHPHKPFRGLGWLELAIRELRIEDYALASELDRWMNGGYPEGVLAFENVKTQDQLDEAVDAFYAQLKRARQKGGIIATSETRYTPLSVAQEMNYVPGMELVERRIMNRAGVPEALYKLNDANLASSYSADPAYARRTLTPALSVDAEQWTELVLPDFGLDRDRMWFAYDPVGEADEAALRADVVYVDRGIKTINEHREELGMEPSDNPLADQLLVNGQPLGRTPDPIMPPGYRPPVVSQPGPVLLPQAGTEEPEVIVERAVKTVYKPALIGKAWSDDDPYAHDECGCCGIQTKDDDRLDISRDAIARMEQIVAGWLNMVAGQISEGTVLQGPAIAGLEAQLERDLEPIVAELFSVGAQQGYSALGIEDTDLFEIEPVAALDALRQHNSLIVEQIRGTTEDGIRRAIEDALSRGLSATEARDVVRESLEEASSWRAETIARTEAAEANVAGSQAAWLQVGVERNTMLLAPDACSICRAVFAKINGRDDAVGQSSGLESKAVPITEPLVRAGETIVGDDGRRMTFRIDRFRTPIHPNDRCAMSAYIPEED